MDFCPPHSHCHWTYRKGRYISFLYWSTREDAERAANGPHDHRITEPPEVYQVHAPGCACESEMESTNA